MNKTDVHTFFNRRYREILQTRLGRISKYEQLQVLHKDICAAYEDKPSDRPHELLREIELQIC